MINMINMIDIIDMLDIIDMIDAITTETLKERFLSLPAPESLHQLLVHTKNQKKIYTTSLMTHRFLHVIV